MLAKDILDNASSKSPYSIVSKSKKYTNGILTGAVLGMFYGYYTHRSVVFSAALGGLLGGLAYYGFIQAKDFVTNEKDDNED